MTYYEKFLPLDSDASIRFHTENVRLRSENAPPQAHTRTHTHIPVYDTEKPCEYMKPVRESAN